MAARVSGAVALFVSRVQALQPSYALTEQNCADLVEICQRLDGLPLAIELAAARVPLLGMAGVRERLDERFRMLTGGVRTALRRHQTLREAIDWSHSLLAVNERAVFRRAGVFAGTFTMDAAQQVLGDGQLDPWEVLEHLGALVDKSLVIAELSEPPRYRLLESARAYALEKMRDAGETDTTRERHAQAILAIFEAGQQQWSGLGTCSQKTHLPDLDNLRAALEWAAISTARCTSRWLVPRCGCGPAPGNALKPCASASERWCESTSTRHRHWKPAYFQNGACCLRLLQSLQSGPPPNAPLRCFAISATSAVHISRWNGSRSTRIAAATLSSANECRSRWPSCTTRSGHQLLGGIY